MFFNQLVAFYKGSDPYIWYAAMSDLNNDKWTFQTLAKCDVPEMDKWVEKVHKDISLNCNAAKIKAASTTIPLKSPSNYSKSDLEKIFYAALKIDESRVRLLTRKTKTEIKKWIKKYVADEAQDASIARYLVKM